MYLRHVRGGCVVNSRHVQCTSTRTLWLTAGTSSAHPRVHFPRLPSSAGMMDIETHTRIVFAVVGVMFLFSPLLPLALSGGFLLLAFDHVTTMVGLPAWCAPTCYSVTGYCRQKMSTLWCVCTLQEHPETNEPSLCGGTLYKAACIVLSILWILVTPGIDLHVTAMCGLLFTHVMYSLLTSASVAIRPSVSVQSVEPTSFSMLHRLIDTAVKNAPNVLKKHDTHENTDWNVNVVTFVFLSCSYWKCESQASLRGCAGDWQYVKSAIFDLGVCGVRVNVFVLTDWMEGPPFDPEELSVVSKAGGCINLIQTHGATWQAFQRVLTMDLPNLTHDEVRIFMGGHAHISPDPMKGNSFVFMDGDNGVQTDTVSVQNLNNTLRCYARRRLELHPNGPTSRLVIVVDTCGAQGVINMANQMGVYNDTATGEVTLFNAPASAEPLVDIDMEQSKLLVIVLAACSTRVNAQEANNANGMLCSEFTKLLFQPLVDTPGTRGMSVLNTVCNASAFFKSPLAVLIPLAFTMDTASITVMNDDRPDGMQQKAWFLLTNHPDICDHASYTFDTLEKP